MAKLIACAGQGVELSGVPTEIKILPLPFTKTPQVINKFAKDISVYNLVSRTGIDESDREKTFLNRYNAAIKFLLDVAKGIISIGVEEKGGSSEAANGFKMKSSGRVFSRDSMRGW